MIALATITTRCQAIEEANCRDSHVDDCNRHIQASPYSAGEEVGG